MTDKKFYPKMTLVLNADVVTEAKDVTVTWEPGLTPVITSGDRGYVEGSRFMTISGSMALPPGGLLVVNPSVAMANREVVSVQGAVGAEQFTTAGIFMTADVSSGPESETIWSFTIEADFAPME